MHANALKHAHPIIYAQKHLAMIRDGHGSAMVAMTTLLAAIQSTSLSWNAPASVFCVGANSNESIVFMASKY
jgi:hypothetical protein